MFITRILCKPKAKAVLVAVKSMVSGHRLVRVRERLADKIEFMHFDPYVQRVVMYKEDKKIRSFR